MLKYLLPLILVLFPLLAAAEDVKPGYYCEMSNNNRFIDVRKDGTAIVGVSYDLEAMRIMGGFSGKPEREWLVKREKLKWISFQSGGRELVFFGEPGFEKNFSRNSDKIEGQSAKYSYYMEWDDMIDSGIEGLRFRLKK